jgi:hypothetical protein
LPVKIYFCRRVWVVRQGGNFNPIETTLMREIKDALDSFSDAFGHLFDYGCCFFPDMIDAYFCPETHRASCDYQNAIKN